jgi:putative ABC transport system substrate-binding protein
MRRREFIAGLGSVPAWPVVVQAQRPLPVIGILSILDSGMRPIPILMDELRAGLAEAGFIEGKYLFIEYRGGTFQQLQSMAADLVRQQVAVIVAVGGAPLLAKRATSTIPIVFYYGGDPVKDGLVASFSRPGGNVTGMTGSTTELAGKRLDLLLKMVPQARKVGFLSVFNAPKLVTTEMLAAGRALGVEIMIVECHDDRDYESALAKMVEGGADAMILSNITLPNLEKVVPLAALHKLPAIYPFRELVRAGGLISYAADPIGSGRRLGSAYVARILKGEKPADLPVEQATKFELVINLSTAKALGLTIPETLLATADEVIQ